MEIRGNVIIIRFLNAGTITTDTVLTSVCERFGIEYNKVRALKYPFVIEHNDDFMYFQKLQCRVDNPVEGFRDTKEFKKDMERYASS